MSNIKLFHNTDGVGVEKIGSVSDVEEPLQTLIEDNLEPLLGIYFVA
jgi:hypothetical protein